MNLEINRNYSAYKTLSLAAVIYFYNILLLMKSISEDISNECFIKRNQMYFRYH